MGVLERIEYRSQKLMIYSYYSTASGKIVAVYYCLKLVYKVIIILYWLPSHFKFIIFIFIYYYVVTVPLSINSVWYEHFLIKM